MFYKNDEMFYKDNDDMDIETHTRNPIGHGLKEYSMFDSIGRTQTNTGVERIVQSMRTIIETPLGTRFFRPTFGSRVHELIFEPNDFILKDLLEVYIRDAITKWEPRVTIEDIVVDPDTSDTVCSVMIVYKMKNSSSSESFIYSLNREIPELR